jgi:hypothetical protein
MHAARNGDIAGIKQIIAEGGSINERDEEGHTVLMSAAVEAHIATVRYLVFECGSSLTETDHNGFNPLHVAAMMGHAELVQWFIEEGGASVNAKSLSGLTCLLTAAHEGHFAATQYLLEAGGASMTETDNHGQTVWTILQLVNTDDEALSSLIKIMVMLEDAPADFIAKLSTVHTEIATRGRQLRAQLPSYLEQQRATIVAQCPLPAVLHSLVTEYAATTPGDMWTDGLLVQENTPVL